MILLYMYLFWKYSYQYVIQARPAHSKLTSGRSRILVIDTYFYRPQTKLWKGNVFTGVPVHGGVWVSLVPGSLGRGVMSNTWDTEIQ